jgi:divalent metal cation (Fe/Co/Zn/Cd) transporter
MASEATVTLLDGILSVSTLVGLALNAYVGWWWADPVAGMLVAIAAVHEAGETLAEARSISAGEL